MKIVLTNQIRSVTMNTTKTKQTNLKEREARIQWTVLNVQQLNMLVVWQMKKPVTKAFTIDYNLDRYEKREKIWRV